MLASVLVAVAGMALLWAVGSLVLRTLAWFLVGAMVVSLIAGIPVPTGVVVGTVVCWAGGHAIHRLLLCSATPTVLSVHDARQ